jgi:hypothetical protein
MFSWDEVIKLSQDCLYEIVFDQDFSACYLGNQRISEVPITTKFALVTEEECDIHFSGPYIMAENDPNNRILDFDDFDDFDDYDDKKVSRRKEQKQAEYAYKKYEKMLLQLGIN